MLLPSLLLVFVVIVFNFLVVVVGNSWTIRVNLLFFSNQNIIHLLLFIDFSVDCCCFFLPLLLLLSIFWLLLLSVEVIDY